MMNNNEELLVMENQRLVHDVIWRKFKGNLSATRIDQNYLLEEMISVGNIGLIKAAKTFDATRGYQFSTYATTAINKALTTYFVDRYGKQMDDGESISMQSTIANTDENVTLEDVLGDERYSESDLVMAIKDVASEVFGEEMRFIVDKLAEGYSKTEIGNMLNMSAQLVQKRIYTLRKELLNQGLK